MHGVSQLFESGTHVPVDWKERRARLAGVMRQLQVANSVAEGAFPGRFFIDTFRPNGVFAMGRVRRRERVGGSARLPLACRGTALPDLPIFPRRIE